VLSAKLPPFPRLAEQAFSEVEALLGFSQLLLDVLDITFQFFKPPRNVGRQ
jgi:hypothetical protein